MRLDLLTPSVENACKSYGAAKISVPKFFQYLTGYLEEQVKDKLLVVIGYLVDLMVYRKDHLVIMDGQQQSRQSRQPLGSLKGTALVAIPVGSYWNPRIQ